MPWSNLQPTVSPL